MDRRVGAAVAGMVVVALALVAWETFDDPGRRQPKARAVELGDGFHVAAGSRLVGAVVPRPPGVVPDDPGGWSALLDVDGDAVTVFDAYADQARRLGWSELAAIRSPCRSSNPEADGMIGSTTTTGASAAPASAASGTVGRVACAGYWATGDRTLSVTMEVCSTCTTLVSAAWIETGPAVAGHGATGIAPMKASGPTLRLSASEHRRAWDQHPAHVQPGSRPLGPDVSFNRCDGDDHTVLEVTGEPRHVFDAYVRAQPPEEIGAVTRARDGDSDVTVWHSRQGRTITLLERARDPRALLAIDVCYISPG